MKSKSVVFAIVVAVFVLSAVYRNAVASRTDHEVDIDGMRVVRVAVGSGIRGIVTVYGQDGAAGQEIDSVADLDSYLARENRRDVYVLLHYQMNPDKALCASINGVLLNRRVAFSVSDHPEGSDIDIRARLRATAKLLGR